MAILALSELMGYLGRIDAWLGVWSETQSAIALGLILSLPAAVASGAWVSHLNEKQGIVELREIASRDAWRVRGRELAETSMWVTLGFTIGSAVGLIATWQFASFAAPSVWHFMSCLSLVVAGVVLGLTVGRRAPWIYVAPVAAAVTYLVIGLLNVNAPLILGAVTPMDDRWLTFFQVPVWIPVVQSAAWTALIAAYVLNGTNARITLLLLWLCGVALAPLLYVGNSDVKPNELATALNCTSASRDVQVCLPQAKQYLAKDFVRHLGKADFIVTGRPVAYVDDETRGISRASNRELQVLVRGLERKGVSVVPFSSFYDQSAYTRVSRNAFLYSLAVAQVRHEPSPFSSSPGLREASPTDVVLRWVLQRLAVPIDGSATYGAIPLDDGAVDYSETRRELLFLESLDDQQSRAWWIHHEDAIRTGTLRFEELTDVMVN